MSPPILALVLIASFFVVVPAASYFKTLDSELAGEAKVPVIAGLIAGVLIRFAGFVPAPIAAGIILTIGALYVRLTGRESEPSDGMTLGAMTGAAAAVALLGGGDELRHFAECVLAGAVAGYGITFALTHVRNKTRQAMVDVITAVAAIVAAWLPSIALRIPRVSDRHVAVTTAALIPIFIIATVFQQWPSIRAELSDEARLGFIEADDVHSAAHPLRRLTRGGWHDAGAHRELVRIASRIALCKRQQRNRTATVARLYQIEVIKLRMELQEMTRIDRAMRTERGE